MAVQTIDTETTSSGTQEWKEPSCRVVCRPFRSKPRKFDGKSVGRVAKYAIAAGEDPAIIVAHVMIALGYDKIICNTFKAMSDLGALVGFVGRVKGIAAILVSLSVLIEWLKQGPIRRLPYARAILVLAIAIFALLDGILGVLRRWNVFSLKLQLAVGVLGAWCGWIRIIRVDQGGTFETDDDQKPPKRTRKLPRDVPFVTQQEFRHGLKTR